MVLVWCLAVVAKTDSRPCVVCRPSMAASYFLLLAQKKVTKENGTLGFAPLAERAVRYGRTGFAHRPSMACCRIGAIPRAARVVTRLVRPPSAAAQREPEEQSERKKKKPTCRIYPVLLRQGLPRSALPGFPLGRGEQVGGNSREARAAQDARRSDLGTRMCRERTPEPARVVCRAWMPGKPRPRGCLFLWLLSFGQAKESNRRPWMVDEPHTDVSRLSQNAKNQSANPNGPRPRRNEANQTPARATRLDVSRPSRSDSHSPVSISFARSTPVAMPMPSSM